MILQLRPRPMLEAADLGVRLVQSQARMLVRTWLPLIAVVALILAPLLAISSWLPWVILFMLKPWLDRSLIFVLSRVVFGQTSHFADLWAARASVFSLKALPKSLTERRLSPWRSYTQAAEQLEGQSGRALRQRKKQLLSGKHGAVAGMQMAFSTLEFLCYFGPIMLLVLLAPQGMGSQVWEWLIRESTLVSNSLTYFFFAAAIAFVEPFFVASGFAMYLNRRVELEAWDVEQEFRLGFA